MVGRLFGLAYIDDNQIRKHGTDNTQFKCVLAYSGWTNAFWDRVERVVSYYLDRLH